MVLKGNNNSGKCFPNLVCIRVSVFMHANALVYACGNGEIGDGGGMLSLRTLRVTYVMSI